MHDPTAVMGRRIGAYFIDLAIGIAVFFVAFLALTSTIDDSRVDCDRITQDESVQVCVDAGDSIRYATGGDAALIYAIPVGVWLVNAVLVQGATGASIGKHLTGLRVVNRDGSPHGLAKALGRWFFFIVDNQPCGVPIVGLVCALASKGHRRVGDMVMGTFVVAKADAGRPVTVGASGPGAPGAYGGPQPPGFGATPPPWGGVATPPPPGAPHPPAPQSPPPPPPGSGGDTPPPFSPPAPPPGGGFGTPS